MKLSILCGLINVKLAGEQLPQATLLPLIDEVIDDINDQLNSIFPVMSDFAADNANGPDYDYNLFPDRYLRKVVVYGAAAKFYSIDEEGIGPAEDFTLRYSQNLYYMIRDYTSQVPLAYQAGAQGFIEDDDTTDVGIYVYGGDIN